jgi:hypothetical protein
MLALSISATGVFSFRLWALKCYREFLQRVDRDKHHWQTGLHSVVWWPAWSVSAITVVVFFPRMLKIFNVTNPDRGVKNSIVVMELKM